MLTTFCYSPERKKKFPVPVVNYILVTGSLANVFFTDDFRLRKLKFHNQVQLQLMSSDFKPKF